MASPKVSTRSVEHCETQPLRSLIEPDRGCHPAVLSATQLSEQHTHFTLNSRPKSKKTANRPPSRIVGRNHVYPHGQKTIRHLGIRTICVCNHIRSFVMSE